MAKGYVKGKGGGRGYTGGARFAYIGSASGRAFGDLIGINKQDYQEMSPGTRLAVVTHEVVHNTVEDYILKNNEEWNNAESVLKVKEGTDRRGNPYKEFYGGNYRIGESIADAIASAMTDDWSMTSTPKQRASITKWARSVTRRAGYSYEQLKKDAISIVRSLDSQLQ